MNGNAACLRLGPVLAVVLVLICSGCIGEDIERLNQRLDDLEETIAEVRAENDSLRNELAASRQQIENLKASEQGRTRLVWRIVLAVVLIAVCTLLFTRGRILISWLFFRMYQGRYRPRNISVGEGR